MVSFWLAHRFIGHWATLTVKLDENPNDYFLWGTVYIAQVPLYLCFVILILILVDCDMTKSYISNCQWIIVDGPFNMTQDTHMHNVSVQCKVEAESCITLAAGTNLTITTATITGNHAARFIKLGAMATLYMNMVNITMFGTRNKTSGFGGNGYIDGGVVHGISGNTVSLDSVHMLRNRGELGGCMYIRNSNSTHITSSSFVSNSGWWGGALYIDASMGTTITKTEFTSNTAAEGGAVHIDASTGVAITDTEFTSNTAGSGGAVYLEDSVVEVRGGVFTNNTATDGGAMYIQFITGRVDISQHTVFAGNTAVCSWCGNTAGWGDSIECNADTQDAVVLTIGRNISIPRDEIDIYRCKLTRL